MPTRAIKAIFFTRFHHEKGSRVLHQIPEGSITPSTSPSALRTPLFSFDSATPYLIPTQQFCDRLLTFCVNHYRIIGYPVCIREGKYSRNEFIFNWAVVVEEGLADWVAYGEVVRKVGRLLRGLEEQGGFVSEEEDAMDVWDDDHEGKAWRRGSGSKVFALCEMLLEDLNNYAECMIPIDDSNTINLKLFPTRPPPPPIHPHQVPILTISLSSLSTPLSSDLTLIRTLPFINGIHSVARIAHLADTDLSLTQKAIQHLVFYGCLVLLDIFSFAAVYAPTAEIAAFITDPALQEECTRYVRVPRLRRGGTRTATREASVSSANGSRASISSSSAASTSSATSETHSTDTAPRPDTEDEDTDTEHTLTPETLITLYTSLRQGLPLRQFVLDNLCLLSGIDVRRLITFGVIKGFLYRVHKYAVATSSSTSSTVPPAPPTSLKSVPVSTAPSAHGGAGGMGAAASDTSTVRNHAHGAIPHRESVSSLAHKHSLAGGSGVYAADAVGRRAGAIAEEGNEARDGRGGASVVSVASGEEAGLVRFLDGMHCFDEICTVVGAGEKVVEGKVRGLGEVQVFSK